MRYYALATDYDGTLATEGRVDEATLAALERLRNSGRRLILVTGRELDELLQVFPQVDLFESVVAENGALLYRPATREIKLLAEAPPARFAETLRARGVGPLSVGRVIVATWTPHETAVLETIRELGLELQVIFNKGAVMVLPSGVNKATGLAAALEALGLSPHNTVGVGDAENDHAFLHLCEASVAVANALPSLKEQADWVTQGSRGAGVTELIDHLLAADLADLEPRLTRHEVPLGRREGEETVQLKPYGVSVLLAGTSGGGKSTLATGFLERLSEKGYQFCIIDPEGDYQNLEGAVVLGTPQRAPTVAEAIQLIEAPDQNVAINLLGITMEDRPAYFEGLLTAVMELRARTGRPHWIVIDETHHLLPAAWAPALLTVPKELQGFLLITVHPDRISRAVLASIDLIIAIGSNPEETIRTFSETLGEPAPSVPPVSLEPGEAIAWWRRPKSEPFWFRSIPPRGERLRHLRKYAEGELGADKSFYFRGPEGKLNLRAQNLTLFLQLADGVDNETWMHHLRQGDYSRWFREAIKDDPLADEAAQIEAARDLSAEESRARIRERIEARYTHPA
ncbi:HAD-IIB family hydrolase [Candidatus Manganitrophus noduliformans]|uniref:HAD-IIB family hydrolase n=1 Tax=Candidatus Manganitrophus noduliformans TaxID=2606439 RepID=A0A7X6DLU1_9BACT|nr:HAD-IIB family hydrolase [Candidatus Manganitrophus noduliformans]NKE69273.1 HAD-IIB family hydrolase [Candidatus Manganitrophus noduliformans]